MAKRDHEERLAAKYPICRRPDRPLPSVENRSRAGNIGEMDPKLEQMAGALVESGDYRVIRRLQPRTEYHPPNDSPKFIAAVVDVETTGTDPERDRIIELGMCAFEYGREDGRIYRVIGSWDWLEDPIDAAPAWPHVDDTSLPAIDPLPGVMPYEFQDLLFAGRSGADRNAAFEFLARRCIALGDAFWVRTGNRWAVHSKTTARPALIQQFLSVNSTPTITKKDISEFLSDGIVRFHGTGMFPGSPEFVLFQGYRYVNEWVDERLRPDTDRACDAEILLRIIRENLCGLDPVPLDEMIFECSGEEPTIFRWVMHWFASNYVRPGRHIGVALWFLGPNMGVGKGTIVGVLRSLLGARWVGKASAEEMDRGWTDFLAGKLLLEADEFEIGNRKALNRLYKQWIGNDLLEITKRHVGSYLIPNTVNHVMTTNEVQPIYLDAGDRRHTVVHTSNDAARNTLAAAFHKLSETEKVAALRGFAAILATINIDEEFISKPFPTEHRALLLSWSRPVVERWFAARDADWPVGKTFEVQQIFERFENWASLHEPRAKEHIHNVIMFGKEMMRLEASGYVLKGKSSRSVYKKIRYYDPASETVAAACRDDPAGRQNFIEIMMGDPEPIFD